MKCDIAVIGAGASGIAAAVAAAESGLKVVLVERYGFTGGLATAAMVGTICGLYYRTDINKHTYAPNFAVQGFARDFAEAVMADSNTRPEMFAEGLHFLPYHLNSFHQIAVQNLKHAKVQLLLHMSVTGVKNTDGQINQLVIQASDRIFNLYPTAVIDCSGHAHISMLAGLHMIKQQHYQSGAFVFQVSGLPKLPSRTLALNLIRWIKAGINSGDLDPHSERLSIIPGSVNQESGLLKLSLPELYNTGLTQSTEYELQARTRSVQIIDYLNRSEPLLKDLKITLMATQVGIRTGPRHEGLKLLKEEDVMTCTKPDDGVAIGAWPIEYWGKHRKPEMSYFKAEDFFLIPAGALVSKHLDNLFFAGRSLSATERAISSARVIGTCLSSGYAAGMLAAESVRKGSWQTAIDKIRAKQVSVSKV